MGNLKRQMQTLAKNQTPEMTVSGQYFIGSLDTSKTGVTISGGSATPSGDRRNDNHLFAYRASSSLFGKRFYFSVFFGKEKRTDARLRAEGRKKPFWVVLMIALTITWMIFWLTVISLGLGVVALYLFKSGAGINLFDGHFFLHSYFFD